MIVFTNGNGGEYLEKSSVAHLACGTPPVFSPRTKRFREGEGRKLFETLKRFVSSGDFSVILVSGFDNVLSSCDRAEVCQWIDDHLRNNDGITLVLASLDPSQVPELS